MSDRRRRFALRLALQLGWPNVDAMLREMTAQQFDEWVAFYQIEPWGILAEDVLSAHWKAIWVNSNRPKGKRAEKIGKFLLFKDKQADASDIYESEEDEWQM